MSELLQTLKEKGVLNQRQVDLYYLLRPRIQEWTRVGDVRTYVKENAPKLYKDFAEYPLHYYSHTLEDDLRILANHGFLTRTLGVWHPEEIKIGNFG